MLADSPRSSLVAPGGLMTNETNPQFLQAEVAALRDELVRLEQELGVERGERVRLEARALEEKLRADGAYRARDRMVASPEYRVGRILVAPLRRMRALLRRITRRG